eukprot:5104499-Prymnesium_polylepis.1
MEAKPYLLRTGRHMPCSDPHLLDNARRLVRERPDDVLLPVDALRKMIGECGIPFDVSAARYLVAEVNRQARAGVGSALGDNALAPALDKPLQHSSLRPATAPPAMQAAAKKTGLTSRQLPPHAIQGSALASTVQTGKGVTQSQHWPATVRASVASTPRPRHLPSRQPKIAHPAHHNVARFTGTSECGARGAVTGPSEPHDAATRAGRREGRAGSRWPPHERAFSPWALRRSLMNLRGFGGLNF